MNLNRYVFATWIPSLKFTFFRFQKASKQFIRNMMTQIWSFFPPYAPWGYQHIIKISSLRQCWPAFNIQRIYFLQWLGNIQLCPQRKWSISHWCAVKRICNTTKQRICARTNFYEYAGIRQIKVCVTWRGNLRQRRNFVSFFSITCLTCLKTRFACFVHPDRNKTLFKEIC